MPPPAEPTEFACEETPSDLVVVGEYANYAAAFEHSVVVLAAGHECWIEPHGLLHRLCVGPAARPRVCEQLARYDRESIGWPPAPPGDHAAWRAPELLTPMVWAVAILTVFHLQAGHPDWIRRGALDPDALFARGEWWRLATALFLHANAEHVLSNLLGGLLTLVALVTTFGRLRGWLLLACASLLGNLAIAALNVAHAYRSLGSSTAVFAGVGLLTGRAVRVVWAQRAHPRRLRGLLVPLAGGCTVLALHGAGGGNVDVPAHAVGFAAGALLGFLAIGSAAAPAPAD